VKSKQPVRSTDIRMVVMLPAPLVRELDAEVARRRAGAFGTGPNRSDLVREFLVDAVRRIGDASAQGGRS